MRLKCSEATSFPLLSSNSASEHVHDSSKFSPNSWVTCSVVRVEQFQYLPHTLYINITFKPFLLLLLLHLLLRHHHRQFLVIFGGDKSKNISIWFLWRSFILGLHLCCGWSFEVCAFFWARESTMIATSWIRSQGCTLQFPQAAMFGTEFAWTLWLISFSWDPG